MLRNVPIDTEKGDYDAEMIRKFDERIADKGFGWSLKELLPKVMKQEKQPEH